MNHCVQTIKEGSVEVHLEKPIEEVLQLIFRVGVGVVVKIIEV